MTTSPAAAVLPRAAAWPIVTAHAARIASRSVLLVGPGAAEAAILAAQAGAAAVTACDGDPAVVDSVNRAADAAGWPVTCRFATPDEPLPPGRFDLVIERDALHRSADPIALLHRLCDATRCQLLLEEPLLDEHAMRRSAVRRWARQWLLHHLPVIWISPFRFGRTDRRRFYFGHAGIRRLLRLGRPDVGAVTVHPSTHRGFNVTRIVRRQIGELIVIAGPGAIGKTTLINTLTSGADAAIARELRLEGLSRAHCVDGCTIMLPIEPLERVVMHYDFSQVFGSPPRPYESDETLVLTRSAERVRFLTLWAPPEELRRRLRQRIAGQRRGATRWQQLLMQIYCDPAALRHAYERWFAYCRKLGGEQQVVDVSHSVACMSVEDWRAEVAARDASRAANVPEAPLASRDQGC